MTDEERAALRAERQKLSDTIDEHFWRFCMCKRSKPPTLVVPELYQRRAEIDRLLNEDRRKSRVEE